ncbi:MAG: hypothetical protein H6981_05920 [Gammaproteobacteria bacterium]|nr:hypothetical protein [Gammaproteobacteria bacterium]MCP5136320.1 hypothetical protein [Gammaproteobacteria bacterium]
MAFGLNPLAVAFVTDHPHEAAAVLALHPPATLAETLHDTLAAKDFRGLGVTLCALPPAIASDVLVAWPTPSLGKALAALNDDELAGLLGIPGAATRKRLLDALPKRRAVLLRRLLAYPPGSIGQAMQSRALTLISGTTVKDAQQLFKQESLPLSESAFVLDAGRRVLGIVPLPALAGAPETEEIDRLMQPSPVHLKALQGVYSVRELSAWNTHPRLPVLNAQGRFVGVLTHAAALGQVMQDEAGARVNQDPSAELIGGLLQVAEALWIPLARLFAAAAGDTRHRQEREHDDGRA